MDCSYKNLWSYKQTDSGEIINSSEEQKSKTVFRRVRLFLTDTETTEWEVRWLKSNSEDKLPKGKTYVAKN